MATTPLKTASRALSIATVMVVGFAAWVLGTQGTLPLENAETPTESGRVVEFLQRSQQRRLSAALKTSLPKHRLADGSTRWLLGRNPSHEIMTTHFLTTKHLNRHV